MKWNPRAGAAEPIHRIRGRRASLRWLAAFGVACVASGLLLESCRRREARQRLEIPLKWARLAPYPESAVDLRATTGGGMFSRSFRVRFRAPVADIDRWLRASPGTREATPERPSPGIRRFAITPGGGAQYAEVTVDDAEGAVDIYVYWS